MWCWWNHCWTRRWKRRRWDASTASAKRVTPGCTALWFAPHCVEPLSSVMLCQSWLWALFRNIQVLQLTLAKWESNIRWRAKKTCGCMPCACAGGRQVLPRQCGFRSCVRPAQAVGGWLQVTASVEENVHRLCASRAVAMDLSGTAPRRSEAPLSVRCVEPAPAHLCTGLMWEIEAILGASG